MGPRPDDDLDSEQLLAQGDELLKASRRLLEQLDDQIQPGGEGTDR